MTAEQESKLPYLLRIRCPDCGERLQFCQCGLPLLAEPEDERDHGSLTAWERNDVRELNRKA